VRRNIIASGYFGKNIAHEIASQLINAAGDAYKGTANE